MRDIKSIHTESGGILISEPCYVVAYQALAGTADGDAVFKDGGESAVERFRFNMPADATAPIGLSLPTPGILFEQGVYITQPSGAKMTLFYTTIN